MSKPTDTRSDLLAQAARDAGGAWMRATRAELRQEGRPAHGGWPGTVREARVHAATEGERVLRAQSLSKLTRDELDQLAASTYEEARRAWGRGE